MNPLMILLTGLGIIIFWIGLNLLTLFRKKKRYYSFAELWEGRANGKHPDNRQYALTGLCVMIIIAALTSYGIL